MVSTGTPIRSGKITPSESWTGINMLMQFEIHVIKVPV